MLRLHRLVVFLRGSTAQYIRLKKEGVMAQINWGKQIVAVIIGGAHHVAKDMDAGVIPVRTAPLKTAADLGAVGVVLAGLGIQVMQPQYHQWGEAAALAATPYVVEAAWDAITAGTAGTQGRVTPKGKYARPRQSLPPINPSQTPPAAGRYPAQVYQREFQGVQLQ